MGIFVCDNCGCVENTALGHFWCKNRLQMMGFPLDTALCSACTPDKFASGESNDDDFAPPSKWHGKFPRKKWDGKLEVMNRRPGDPAVMLAEPRATNWEDGET